jgi:ABC-type dipeptide/oligopeptide/nickel transport system ATPase component
MYRALFISHNIRLVRHVSNVIAVMYQGQMIEYGATEQVINQPSEAHIHELLSTAKQSSTAHLN